MIHLPHLLHIANSYPESVHKERFYAISVERRLKHPAVVRISDVARTTLFGSGSKKD